MPTFDFSCTACGHVFEKTISFGSKTKPACPTCGSKKTEKQISPPAVHFRGSGFYRTDSASSQNQSTKPANTPKATESAKPAETPKTPDKAKPESTSKTSEK